MHDTNGHEITSQCVLIRNEMKMNHATMEVNGMIIFFLMQLLAYEGVTSWHFHSAFNLYLSFNS